MIFLALWVVVASFLLLRAEAGSRPGGRGTCSLLRQRKVPKRKATLLSVSLRFATGNLRCSKLGCAEELPALPLRGSSGQTASASQMTMRVCPAAHAPPQLLRFSARPEGTGGPMRAIASLGLAVLRCARLAKAIASVASAARSA